MLERLVLLEQQVQEAKEALQEKEGKWGPMAYRGPKVVQVDQDQMDKRVTQVHQVLMESLEVQDFRGCQGREAYQDPQGQREMLALLEEKDLKEKLERMV